MNIFFLGKKHTLTNEPRERKNVETKRAEKKTLTIAVALYFVQT